MATFARYDIDILIFDMSKFFRMATVTLASLFCLALHAQDITTVDPQTVEWVRRQTAAGSSQKEIQTKLI